jgi:ATP-dependent Zn protease
LCPKADIFPTTPNINNNSNAINIKTKTNNNSDDVNQRNASPVTQEHAKKSGTGFFTILTSILALIFVAMCWVFYAYTHPHTSSGQLLIQYRPNNWSWRRGEARYTAATIHM